LSSIRTSTSAATAAVVKAARATAVMRTLRIEILRSCHAPETAPVRLLNSAAASSGIALAQIPRRLIKRKGWRGLAG
jgi:hypothetical protein